MTDYTLAILLENDQADPNELERSTLSLEKELAQNVGGIHRQAADGHKDIDPLAFATLTVAIAPIVVTKFFEFLNTWALRRENRHVRIKLQLGKDKSIEFEGSETLSKEDVEKWIRVLDGAMKKK
ncbi:MAG: hypothetical protein HY869_02485 [Chloroflexi bacterium]|nr:hypothetical protein [Chloroflexota bacterium]